jgi:hypothetical protein
MSFLFSFYGIHRVLMISHDFPMGFLSFGPAPCLYKVRVGHIFLGKRFEKSFYNSFRALSPCLRVG